MYIGYEKIHVLWMLLFLVLSTSCVSVNRLMKVQEGMSRQEISKIFGTPEYRRFDRGMEEWEYRSLSLISGEYKVVVITFEDGRVSGMDTFTTRDSKNILCCRHLVYIKMGCFPKKFHF